MPGVMAVQQVQPCQLRGRRKCPGHVTSMRRTGTAKVEPRLDPFCLAGQKGHAFVDVRTLSRRTHLRAMSRFRTVLQGMVPGRKFRKSQHAGCSGAWGVANR